MGKTYKRYNRIEEIPALKDVNPQTLSSLAEKGNIQRHSKGEVLLRVAQRQDNALFMLSGQAILYTLTREGNRKIIFILGPGELLNESLMDPERSPVFVELIRDSKVFSIPLSVLHQLMSGDFSLTRALMSIQERKLWRTSHQLKNTPGRVQLERKLAAKLWKLGRDFGVEEPNGEIRIDVKLSVTFLADFLGAPRETTSRICKDLVRKGLIRMDQKVIYLPDMERVSHFFHYSNVSETE